MSHAPRGGVIESAVEDDVTRPVATRHRPDAAARDRARLAVLADVGLLLASSGDHVDILQQLTEMTVPTMADWCAVHLLDKLGQLQRLAVRQADPHKLLLFEMLSVSPQPDASARGIARVAATGMSEWGVLGPGELYLAVPLQVRGRVIGVLSLVRSGAEYDREEASFAEELARRVAMYVDNAMLLREVHAREAALRDEAARLEALNRVGQQLAELRELGDVLSRVSEAATSLTGAELGLCFTCNEGEAKYAACGVGFIELQMLHDRRRELTRDLVALALPGAVRVDDVRSAPPGPRLALVHDLRRTVSYLAVPVLGPGGELAGGIAVAHSSVAAFDECDERLLVGLANLTATSTVTARLFHEARELIATLERSNFDLDQFASATCHDLRAPLRGIANLASWIEEDLAEHMTGQAREHMSLLRHRVRRLEDMIQGALDYSRAGDGGGDPEPVDSGALVRETVELLSPPDDLAVAICGDLPIVQSPRSPLQQVFMNLVSNAIKHNTAPHRRVEIGAEPAAADAWEFFVRDNGPGIAPRFHAQIWELFRTLRSTDQLDGTGIGLAIVRRIVEAHGGRAWVDSSEGAGATFRFTWPKLPQSPRAWR